MAGLEGYIIGFNGVAMTASAFFVGMWIRGVNSTLKDLYDKKTSKSEFGDYKTFATEQREGRDREIVGIKKQLNSHGHLIDCNNDACGKATAGRVILS